MEAAALKEALAPERRSLIVDRLRAELAKRWLYEFVKQSWHVLEPGAGFEDNWHIEAFCFHVQMVLEGWLVANGHGTEDMKRRVRESWERHGLEYAEGELLVQNLILNLPPITLKSRILMVLAPSWIWLHCPSFKVCAISGVYDNVKRDSHAHRDLVESPWYRENFLRLPSGAVKWEVRGDVNAVDEWMTTAGGERKSRPILGGFTGIHSDGIFLDDPDDAHKVHNEPARREVQGKWRRAIKNRVQHLGKSIRIAIQQRVHVDDWTSAQIAKGVWKPTDRKAWAWIVMPLLFGRGPKEAPTLSPWGWTDPRQVANDNMQPSRFSESVIADEMRDMGPEGFEGQYNQNPTPLDGGMIKRSYVKFFRIEGEPMTSRGRPMGCGLLETGELEPALVLKRLEDGSLDLDWLTVTVDCTFGSTSDTASAVGLLVVGGKGMQRFIFDDLTEVMTIEQMYDAVANVIRRYKVTKALIELKAAGSSLVNDLKKKLETGDLLWPDGTPAIVVIETMNPGKDSKESRAFAMVDAWRAGLVFVLDGADWLYAKVHDGRTIDPGFIGEVCTFPRSRRNDRVDAMSQLMTFYREVIPNRTLRAARW